MSNKLEQLKTMTTVVADTGDIEAMRQYKPIDATTNPSLLLKASAIEEYAPLLEQCIRDSKESGNADLVAEAGERFAVYIGREILKLVP